jgi:hypothetical protein
MIRYRFRGAKGQYAVEFDGDSVPLAELRMAIADENGLAHAAHQFLFRDEATGRGKMAFSVFAR